MWEVPGLCERYRAGEGLKPAGLETAPAPRYGTLTQTHKSLKNRQLPQNWVCLVIAFSSLLARPKTGPLTFWFHFTRRGQIYPR